LTGVPFPSAFLCRRSNVCSEEEFVPRGHRRPRASDEWVRPIGSADANPPGTKNQSSFAGYRSARQLHASRERTQK
jgi:hypothetical protein